MADKKISELNVASPLSGTEVIPITQSGETVKVALDTLVSFAITERSLVPIDRPFQGALVYRTSNFNPPSSGYETIAWQAEDYDVGNFWSIGAPTRFTIPAGVSKIRLTGYIRGVNNAQRTVFFRKNGNFFLGGSVPQWVTASDAFSVSAVVRCVAGDFFEMQQFGTTDAIQAGVDGTSQMTFFAIEAMEVA